MRRPQKCKKILLIQLDWILKLLRSVVNFINISSSDMWDYAVPTSANAIFTNCVRHETSLIARINHVIQLVGPSCYSPLNNPHSVKRSEDLFHQNFKHWTVKDEYSFPSLQNDPKITPYFEICTSTLYQTILLIQNLDKINLPVLLFSCPPVLWSSCPLVFLSSCTLIFLSSCLPVLLCSDLPVL